MADAYLTDTFLLPVQTPLLPVGWLTVMIASIKHPPLILGQQLPDTALTVVVRVADCDQFACSVPDKVADNMHVTDGAELTATLTDFFRPPDEVHFGASLTFPLSRQKLQDKTATVVVEVHGSGGIHGTTTISLSKATRPAGEFDGAYEMINPLDDTNAARGYKLHGEICPTKVALRFDYLTASQKSVRTSQPSLYYRGPVVPFSDRDLTLRDKDFRRSSRQKNQRPASAANSKELIGISQGWGTPGLTYDGAANSKALIGTLQGLGTPGLTYDGRSSPMLDAGGVFGSGPRSRLPPRPMSAQEVRRRPDWTEPLDPNPTHLNRIESPDLKVYSRSQTNASNRPERPKSAMARTTRTETIFAEAGQRFGRPVRPESAGARRRAITTVASSTLSNCQTQVLMMPIVRAAELHSPRHTDKLYSPPHSPPRSPTAMGTLIEPEIYKDSGCGLSDEGQSILTQIEAGMGKAQRDDASARYHFVLSPYPPLTLPVSKCCA